MLFPHLFLDGRRDRFSIRIRSFQVSHQLSVSIQRLSFQNDDSTQACPKRVHQSVDFINWYFVPNPPCFPKDVIRLAVLVRYHSVFHNPPQWLNDIEVWAMSWPFHVVRQCHALLFGQPVFRRLRRCLASHRPLRLDRTYRRVPDDDDSAFSAEDDDDVTLSGADDVDQNRSQKVNFTLKKWIFSPKNKFSASLC
jgi:hypothetical protein